MVCIVYIIVICFCLCDASINVGNIVFACLFVCFVFLDLSSIRAVGWERDASNKPKPRKIDLAQHLDPTMYVFFCPFLIECMFM